MKASSVNRTALAEPSALWSAAVSDGDPTAVAHLLFAGKFPGQTQSPPIGSMSGRPCTLAQNGSLNIFFMGAPGRALHADPAAPTEVVRAKKSPPAWASGQFTWEGPPGSRRACLRTLVSRRCSGRPCKDRTGEASLEFWALASIGAATIAGAVPATMKTRTAVGNRMSCMRRLGGKGRRPEPAGQREHRWE